MDAKIEEIVRRLNASETRTAEIAKEADQFFLIVMAVVIFFMQCGFAFLEAGSVRSDNYFRWNVILYHVSNLRSKNTVNILIKNMLDAFIGGVSYWSVQSTGLQLSCLTFCIPTMQGHWMGACLWRGW